MHHFNYTDGILHAEGVSLPELAKTIGTPFYCYSTATLERHYKVFVDAFAGCDILVCYAVKANSNVSVIKTLAQLGAGADVVSEGEIRLARAAGVLPDKIVFSGVGKTRQEMAFALDQGIFAFNVEAEAELRILSEVAYSKGAEAKIALRINPDVDAKTHAKISTGKSEHKFGVSWRDARSLYALAQSLPAIKVHGVHMHIGSQITQLEPFRHAFELLADLVQDLRGQGHQIDFVNLGGGLGIPYRPEQETPPDPKDYASMIAPLSKTLNARLLFEPGRMIVGNAGILVTQVIYTKHSSEKQFVIVDAGMNDLIRPTLYDAYHDIWPVHKTSAGQDTIKVDIVGPVCETGDFLAKDRVLSQFQPGDLIAIMTAGAYGAVQANTYNARLLVPEVMVNKDHYAIIRPRPTYEDMLRTQTIAPWLNS